MLVAFGLGEIAGLGANGVIIGDDPLAAFLHAEGVLDFTSPAGTVADSMPRNANIVSGAIAASAEKNGTPLGFSVSKSVGDSEK